MDCEVIRLLVSQVTYNCIFLTKLSLPSNYYQTLPSLAVNCSLANITRLPEDPYWPEEAAEFLEENLRDCLVKVRIVSCQGDKPSVEIYTQPASGVSGISWLVGYMHVL